MLCHTVDVLPAHSFLRCGLGPGSRLALRLGLPSDPRVEPSDPVGAAGDALPMSLNETLTAWGTLALAGVASLQALVTRQAVTATRVDVAETRRARVDATAPRVTFVSVATSWPPHIPDASDVTGRVGLTPTHQYVLPRDGDIEIFTAGTFSMTNEGTSTALVTLPPGSMLVGTPDDPPRDLPTAQALARDDVVVLGPGQRGLIWVRTRRTVHDWAVLSAKPLASQTPATVRVIVTDTFDDGVTDVTDLGFQAHALSSSGLNDHAWRMNPLLAGQPDAPVLGIASTTRRSYRGEPVTRHWLRLPGRDRRG